MSATFQRASAPYPSLDRPVGGVLAPVPRLQLFLVGSASGVIVTVAGETVLSTVRTADFQVPKTALGVIGRPPCCQSPALLFGSLLMSVTNSDGHIGRSDASRPLWSPVSAFAPMVGLVTLPGLAGSADTG